MIATGRRYRVHCIGSVTWKTENGFAHIIDTQAGCGWKGYRTASVGCECYDEWRMYCRPLTPGPGCPSGVVWPCPRCKGKVNGVLVSPKKVENG